MEEVIAAGQSGKPDVADSYLAMLQVCQHPMHPNINTDAPLHRACRTGR